MQRQTDKILHYVQFPSMLIHFISGHKVKKDWQNLRDYYKASIRNPSKKRKKFKWYFEDEMSFLMPYIKHSNDQLNEFPRPFEDDDTTGDEELHDNDILMDRKQKEELIKLVKAEPALYDKEHENHNNRATVSKIWNEIGETLGFSCKLVNQIYQQFLNICFEIICLLAYQPLDGKRKKKVFSYCYLIIHTGSSYVDRKLN